MSLTQLAPLVGRALDDEDEYPPVVRSIAGTPPILPGTPAPPPAARNLDDTNDYPPVSIRGAETADPNGYAPVERPGLTADPNQGSRRSITGLTPPIPYAPVNSLPPTPGRSITGMPPATAAPPISITGLPPALKPRMPETLGQVQGGIPAPPSGPNAAQDVLAGRVAPPEWRDYRPTHLSVARRAAAIALGTMAGMHDPRLGAEVSRSIAYGPELRRYSEDSGEYRGLLDQGERQDKARQESIASGKTARGENGEWQWNPSTERYDIPVGGLEDGDRENTRRSLGLIASEGSRYGGPAPLGTPPKTVESGGQAYEFNQGTGHFDRPVGTPKRFTDPFEAFTYGNADERKGAQDFITFEKQQGSRFEKPGEIEQRYALYNRDPEAYKAMFGDRGAAQDSRDQAQATRMLQYFDRQRKAIQNDFTIDDGERQRQLGEIDDLEKPYLDIAQPGGSASGAASNNRNAASNAGGPRAGEVEVISPNGQRGYIPKKNLAKALKRGYKQPSAQAGQ